MMAWSAKLKLPAFKVTQRICGSLAKPDCYARCNSLDNCRFVLSSPGSRVGDKWLLSASGTTKGMNLITYSRCNSTISAILLAIQRL